VLLSAQMSEFAASGEVDVFAIIEVNQFVSNTVQNRRLVILLDFKVLRRGEDVQEEIGSPTPLEVSGFPDGASSGGATGGQNRPVLNAQQQRQPPLLRDSAPATGARSVAVSHSNANGASAHAPPPNVFPLHSVTPYQNKWCVRVRVTKKNPIKTYHNSRGEGKLFSVDLADESGEMRATGFNQECDKYYDFLKEGAVYFIKGGSIKSANRKFSSINNDYELTFNSDTQIEPCFDDNVFQVPTVTFNFVKLDKLPTASRERVVDVIGVLESFSQCQSVNSRKTNQELKKRDLRLVDDSLNSVSLTMWGEEAEKFDPDGHPVVAIKGVRISDYNGLSLSTVSGSQTHINPDVPEAYRLRGWYDAKGHDAPLKSLSGAGGSGQGSGGGYIPIALAEAGRLGTGDKPDYYNVKGFISFVKKENCMYKACATEDCNKKVIDQGTGRYRCERCNKEQDTFKWRILLNVTASDFSGAQQVTLFNEQAEHLIGMSAQDLADMKERSDEEFNMAMDKLLFKQFSFRLRAKMELYNDEQRVKVQCNNVDELNVNSYIKFLTEEIQKMEALPDAM